MNLLFLIFGSLVTYISSAKQKENELLVESKKAFLEKRINAHLDLLSIIFNAKKLTGPALHANVSYYIIFRDAVAMNEWFEIFLDFVSRNKPLLSQKIIYQSVVFNNIRRIIELVRSKNDQSNIFLMNFGIKYQNDFKMLFNELEYSIQYFFENEVQLKYQYPIISKADYEIIEGDLKKLIFIKRKYNQ